MTFCMVLTVREPPLIIEQGPLLSLSDQVKALESRKAGFDYSPERSSR
jgi:hypothetical protein